MKNLFKTLTLQRPESTDPAAVGLPANTRLYCIGDIHGRHDLLLAMHSKIAADAACFEGSKILLYLGDYIDRGMHSKQVVDTLLQERWPGFEYVYLMGNHERILLDFLYGTDLSLAHEWFRFGGLPTLQSYGVQIGGIPTHNELRALRFELQQKIPEPHLRFFETLQLCYEIGGYFFVHAGIKPKVKLHKQRPEDMLWIRDEFLQSGRFHGKIIVHGHSVSEEPDIRANRIGLDTGAYASGKLTCAVFEDSGYRFL